jgi:hypothetical protein
VRSKQRLDLTAQQIIAGARIGKKTGPLGWFAFECSMEELIDLPPPVRLHLVARS